MQTTQKAIITKIDIYIYICGKDLYVLFDVMLC